MVTNSLLSSVEASYKWTKLTNKMTRANTILSIDWKEVNEKRVELGLPKVSNETARKAYIDNILSEDMSKELELELKYNALLREYHEQRFKEVKQDE